MKKIIISSIIVLTGLIANGSVDSAFKLCMAIDRTGLASKECEVSGWDSKVKATFDTTSSEARNLCPQIANIAKQNNWSFNGGWTLEIYSPYSNNNTIAYCEL